MARALVVLVVDDSGLVRVVADVQRVARAAARSRLRGATLLARDEDFLDGAGSDHMWAG